MQWGRRQLSRGQPIVGHATATQDRWVRLCTASMCRTSMSKSSMFSRTAASKVSCSKQGRSGEGLAGAASSGGGGGRRRRLLRDCPAGDQSAVRARCRSCCTARMTASCTGRHNSRREAKRRVHGFAHLRDALGAGEFGKLLRRESRHGPAPAAVTAASPLRADRQSAGQLDRSCSTN